MSVTKIRTTHTGSLPRTPELIAANAARLEGKGGEDHDALLTEAVAKVVAKQKELGIDIPNDGEYGHTMGKETDYGAWWTYSFGRFGGLETSKDTGWQDAPQAAPEPGEIQLTSFQNRRDWVKFADVYGQGGSGVGLDNSTPVFPVVSSELTYTGQEETQRDVRNLQQALSTHGYETGYLAAVAPLSGARVPNAFYRSDDELLDAVTAALREEYRIILDSGLRLQLDDPALAEGWDQVNPEPPLADYQRWVAKGVRAINTALEGLNTDNARLHVCWGSWHGPHTTDIPFGDIVEQVLEAKVGGIVIEAGNVRHEHEWRVWQDHQLPEGVDLAVGVVSHATNVVEHPQLVADRLVRFAELVGPERVIATTDCGLGGRIHPQLAWAKLESLAEGAQIASAKLFG